MAGENDDLFKAMSMFSDAAKGLALQRAITGANEQVGQIRSSELKEEQKRAELENVSRNLVAQMAGMGAHATTIEQVAGAFGPKKFATSNQMYAEGLLSGDQGLKQQAQEQQAFEQNPEYKKQLIAAKASNSDPLRMMAFQNQIQTENIKMFEKFSKTLDPSAEVRSQMGQSQLGLEQVARVKALIPADPNERAEMNIQQINELASGIGRLLTGGVPADHTIRQFVPKTSGTIAGDVKQFLTNKPAPAQLEGFVNLYEKMLSREAEGIQARQDENIIKRAQGNLKLRDRDPEQFVETLAERLGVDASDIEIKGKKIIVKRKRGDRQPQAVGVQAPAPTQAQGASPWFRPYGK